MAIVHVPSGYDATTPLPLVVNMHGSQSTALAQEIFSGMNVTADADSFIVVYPAGGHPRPARVRMECSRGAAGWAEPPFPPALPMTSLSS